MTHIVQNNTYDITIIGGGPTGLFAAFYAGLRDMRCKIIDSMPMLGGRLMAVYPEKYIYDVGGLPKVLAKDLVQNLIDQITPYQPQVCLGEHVQKLEFQNDIWQLTTDKDTHFTKTVLIAGGTGLYAPKKHQALGADQFEGRGLSYAVTQKQDYKDKNVVIFGGGDSALDWANELVIVARTVTLIHRSGQFRAHDASVQKLLKSTARVHLNEEAVEFLTHDHLHAIKIRHVDTGIETIIACDSALVLFGFSNTLGEIQNWDLNFESGGICVNAKMQTNLPGIFAAGDIARYEGKLDLIATGFSEAATAIAFAKNYINPKIKPQPLYSTTVMEIKEKKIRGLHNQAKV